MEQTKQMNNGRTIVLHSYTPEWEQLFNAERERLLGCLAGYVLDIQHIGSTAVPGLPAKPIIDIGVAVANFEEAFRCVPLLETLGYIYRGEFGIPRRHYFVRGEPRTYQVHMNEIGSADWKNTIAFRNYLREHPEVAGDYAVLKKQLVEQFPTDIHAYTDGKSEFIHHVLQVSRA
jgi:GrpB-like predicted nucleotidyltransferase (UPF0157 family)